MLNRWHEPVSLRRSLGRGTSSASQPGDSYPRILLLALTELLRSHETWLQDPASFEDSVVAALPQPNCMFSEMPLTQAIQPILFCLFQDLHLLPSYTPSHVLHPVGSSCAPFSFLGNPTLHWPRPGSSPGQQAC